MREILFRGKRTDNDEWAFGFFTKSPSGNVYITETVTGCASPKTVDPDTVGQFTGLTDKNGKKIFEGDVFEWGYAGVKEFRYVVAFDATLASFVGERHFGFVSLNGIDIEIIGNIHDNPELLGGAEDGN